MKIIDVETGTFETIRSPMSTAALKGCHPVQNLGAVQTYLRRYLWSAAIELVEADKLDATVAEDKETLPKDRFVAKKFPAVAKSDKPAAAVSGGELWPAVTISNVKPFQKEGWKKPMYWVELEDDERSAFTFTEPLANDAKIVLGQVVNLKVKRSARDASKFEYLGFEAPAAETTPEQDELGYLK
jgi:hypothetical protein